VSWGIHGNLDTEALRKALESIVQRHEPLRTIFKHDGKMPIQLVQQLDRFELPVLDLRGYEPQAKRLQVEQIVESVANGVFDLTCDLMIRAKLLRLEDQEYQLILTMHHIASDGWSMDVLSRELSALYRHFVDAIDDLPSPLEPLPVSYIDYSRWQRENLSGHRIEGLLGYWREELQGVPSLELPMDRPRPAVASYRGSSVEVKLPQVLISKLESLCTGQQVTLQMLLLAAFESLLYRYSHQEDFAVGIPFAGREDTQLEGLIGFFVSTLVIRADLSGDPTFQELLSRVRQKSLAAYDHQALPLQVLLADLQPARHLSRPPLFQVMFQLLNRAESDLTLRGLEVVDQDYGGNRVKFDLELHLSRQEGEISGGLYYSTDLFDGQSIQRMALHYVRLLESIVANPNAKVSCLEMLTEQERTELLLGFNDTATDYPRDLCVHEFFEQQAQRTPDAVALIFEDQQLTYGELNARANRLARYLRSKGVGIETPVGMCLDRSLELVVSILGILKAGGTYVPLDAEYPMKRLEYMLSDSGIKHLVTQSEFLDKLPKTDRLDICIDTDADRIANEDPSDLGIEFDSNRLAYIIFTSGSTGQPKGVMIEHRSIVRLVFQDCYASFGSDRVFMQLAPISFDASTFEVWGALLHGARLVIPNPGLHDGTMLQDLICRHGVTTMWLTSSLFNQIVQQDPLNLAGLDELLIGGESLSPTHVKSAMDSIAGELIFVNGYGPTECTTFACCFKIPSDLLLSRSSIPIGRPIANTQAYLLDAHQALVPIGVAGELYIGGDGLARGYLNRPELTAERFIQNPFSQDSNSRLYRTGDLCRWRSDGNLEYLGRIDHQVKLRGFRIELGEIEASLSQHPMVAQCVVILREDRPGDKRLVAYYTAAGELLPSVAQLREHLGTSLPEYMIPSACVLLDALPLTPSGKIDRRALPAVELKDIGTEDQYTPARNGIEEQLVQIWQEILGIERIGIQDNFFALGGHSLLAVQLFHAINQRFQKSLPIALVFQRGSIAQIASCIEQATDDSPIARVVRLSKANAGPKLIVMPGHNGQLLYAIKLVERLENRFDIYGLEPHLSHEYLETFSDFRRLANEYVKIILEHQPTGPFNFVGYSYGGFLGYEIARQLQRLGHRVDFVGVIDTGPDPRPSSKHIPGLAAYWMRVLGNLPSWVGANCGPEDIKETAKKANRRLRYIGRRILSGGKTEYRFEDEFGHNRSHDSRREILGRIFQGFNGYQPESYTGRVTLFRASVRPLLHSLSPDLGWSRVAREVIVHRILGDHNTILESAGMNRIGDLIAQSQNPL
jgi:amino acid adenylation domain-containing protein